ncbi:MAG: 16S rRNA (guanine(527)-N(7))-methyltransferase RsmG [Candidatus Kapaibacterium sp.]
MTLDDLQRIANANGLALSGEQLAKLGAYAAMLTEWNAKVNLISRKDEENILSKHILHSLVLVMPKFSSLMLASKVFDLGTGGGLPGIPMKIARPDLEVTLCDSITKKVTAASNMIARLELTNTHAVVGRAEDIAKSSGMSRSFDAIVSRAVAPLDELVMWSKGLAKSGATLYALKGGDLTEEIARSKAHGFVRDVQSRSLDLIEYDGFAIDGKLLVTVRFV